MRSISHSLSSSEATQQHRSPPSVSALSLSLSALLLRLPPSSHGDTFKLLWAVVQASPGKKRRDGRTTREERTRKRKETRGIKKTRTNDRSTFFPPLTFPAPREQPQPQPKKKHQLVVVNISDHVTRAKVSSGGTDEETATARVAGCLLGSVGAAGTRTVDVANSFELVVSAPGAQPDAALLRRRLDQCACGVAFWKEERERGRRRRGRLSSQNSRLLFSKREKETKTRGEKKTRFSTLIFNPNLQQTSRPSLRSTPSGGTRRDPSPSPPGDPGRPLRRSTTPSAQRKGLRRQAPSA